MTPEQIAKRLVFLANGDHAQAMEDCVFLHDAYRETGWAYGVKMYRAALDYLRDNAEVFA